VSDVLVHLPGLLDSYTGGLREVRIEGASLAEVVRGLDARWPGLGFRLVDEQDRIRTHVNFFVNSEQVRSLDIPLDAKDEVHVIGSLAGG
jgi:molybdopterin converting factor small subunit